MPPLLYAPSEFTVQLNKGLARQLRTAQLWKEHESPSSETISALSPKATPKSNTKVFSFQPYFTLNQIIGRLLSQKRTPKQPPSSSPKAGSFWMGGWGCSEGGASTGALSKNAKQMLFYVCVWFFCVCCVSFFVAFVLLCLSLSLVVWCFFECYCMLCVCPCFVLCVRCLFACFFCWMVFPPGLCLRSVLIPVFAFYFAGVVFLLIDLSRFWLWRCGVETIESIYTIPGLVIYVESTSWCCGLLWVLWWLLMLLPLLLLLVE